MQTLLNLETQFLLILKGESPFPVQWIYVHNDKLKTGRITNFKNWTPTINKNQKDTILCLILVY